MSDHNRSYFSLANYLKRFIIVTGGRIGNRITKTALVFTIATCKFSEIVAMNKPREDHSSSTLGNSVFVFGGLNTNGPMNSIERLKIAPDSIVTAPKWDTIALDPGFAPRANPAVCAISSSKVLICGGSQQNKNLSDIWVVNAKTRTMQKIANAPFGFHCLS